MTKDFDLRWNTLPHLFAVVDEASDRFLRTASRDERLATGEIVVDLGIDARPPDLVRERYDATADDPEAMPYHRRLATKEEIAESESAIRDEVEKVTLDSYTANPVHEASLVYFERERYLDRNGRYPTTQELSVIVERQRVIFRELLKAVASPETAARQEVGGGSRS